MASISLRHLGPTICVACLSSSIALATEAPATDASAAPTGDTSAAAATPATPATPTKKDDGEADPKTRPAPNTIYAELAGAGTLYSINYERRFIDDLGVRLGFCFFAAGASASAGGTTASAGYKFLTIPITASYLGIRGGKHGLELGGGLTFRYDSATASVDTTGAEVSAFDAYGVVMVGYRLHPVGKAGFNFRIGAMALAGKRWNYLGDNAADFGVFPFGYMSLGASF